MHLIIENYFCQYFYRHYIYKSYLLIDFKTKATTFKPLQWMSEMIKCLVNTEPEMPKLLRHWTGKNNSQNIMKYLKSADNTCLNTLTFLSLVLLWMTHNLLFDMITLPFRCLSSRWQCYSYEIRNNSILINRNLSEHRTAGGKEDMFPYKWLSLHATKKRSSKNTVPNDIQK